MSDTIRIPKEQYALTLDASHAPVATVHPPATVTFQTGDFAARRLVAGESLEQIGLHNFNAVTGPLFVEGAAPGDAMRLELLDVQIDSAWSLWIPGFGRLGDYTETLKIREIPIEGQWAIINQNLRVPLEPMVGCVALAPATGVGSTLRPAYPWGGNMDLRELAPGAVLWLPVQVAGGLLFVGDLHAAMGVFEPTSVSLESAGSATFRISLEKNRPLSYPRLEADHQLFCIGMGADLNAAIQTAMDQAYALLVEEWGMEPFDAYAYASARVGVRLGGPASPMALACVPRPTDLLTTPAPAGQE